MRAARIPIRPVFIALLLAIHSLAQVTLPTGSLISGKLINPSGGDPVAMASVHLLLATGQRPIATVTSDAAGNFYLPNVAPGSYRLSAERTEYIQGEYGAATPGAIGQTVVVSAGKNVTGLKFLFAPMGVITGTVFGDDGDPLSGATLVALRATEGRGQSTLSQVARTSTNDLGVYRLHGLAPGRYYVKLLPNGRMSKAADRRSVSESREFFYPHSANWEQATALDIAPGSVLTGTDFSLPPASPADDRNAFSGGARVSGQIRSAIADSPISKAHVYLSSGDGESDDERTVITDGAGNFAFDGVAPGQYRVHATHGGFMPDGRGSARSVAVEARQSVGEIDLTLRPEGVIAGRILEGSAPVSNAIVMATRSSLVAGKRRMTLVSRTYSNDLGEYRLFDLPPGHYYLSVNYQGGVAPGSATAEDTGSVADYVTTFYPGALSLADAVPIDVTPGSVQSSIDVALFRIHKLSVSGRFLLPDGVRFSALTAALIPRDPMLLVKFSQRSAAVTSSGEFEIHDVTPGAYILSLDANSESGQYSAAMPMDLSNKDVVGLQVSVIRSLSVRGRLTIDGPEKFDLSQLSVNLSSTNPVWAGLGGSAPVGKDGTFVIDTLRPDQYTVSVSGLPEHCYLKSVLLGSRQVIDSELTIAPGSPAIALQVSAAGGEISGDVTDDEHRAVHSAVVVVIPNPPLRSRVDLYKMTSTDEEGAFSLKGLAPGDYKVFAWDAIDADSYLDPDFLANYESLGQYVAVQENGETKVQLTMIATAASD